MSTPEGGPCPPRLARRLLGLLLPEVDRGWVMDELDELHRERAAAEGARAARRWYRRQLPSFAWRIARDRAARMGRAVMDPGWMGEVVAVDSYLADLKYALRRLAHTPAFTAVAVLSLALGIGANTAIFSVVNAVLLRDLPLEDPDRIVEVYTSEADGFPHSTTSYPDLVDLRDGVSAFASVVGTRTFLARLEEGGVPTLAFGELVSWDYFQALGVPMALGRSFLPDEDETPGTHPVAVLGHRTWLQEFGGDPGILGRTVTLNGNAFIVVGVLPASYTGSIPVLSTGYYLPMMMTDAVMGTTVRSPISRRGSRSLFVKARLGEGVTVERANQELEAFSRGLAEAHPETNRNRIMSALPTGDVSLHPVVDRALVPVAGLLLAVVGLVLLIACANLASFLLARAEDRRKEIALRLALGAGRGRLVRQLLVETVLLASLGGVAGFLVARWTVGLLLSFQPPLPVPVDLVVELDGTVLAFTAAVSVVAGLVFGLVPALQSTNPDVAPTLKDEGTGTRKPSRFSLRDALVVAQVAFSFILLIGAGLFVRSLQKAQRIDPGFDTGGAAVVWPMAEISGYDEEEIYDLNLRIRDRLLAHPLIDEVAMTDRLPLGSAVQTQGYTLPGVPSETPDGDWDLDNGTVMPGYFQVMSIPLVRGRGFTEADLEGEAVAVVSQAFVDRFYPGEEVVGKEILFGESSRRIVGVARDTKVRTLGESPRPFVYESARREWAPGLQFLVRGSAPPAELVATTVEIVKEVDPDLVIFEAKTMDEHLALMLFPPRMAALLLSVFGGLALILAAIGIYGVVSHAVARRTREMGIRLSLGATSGDVVGMAVGGGMRLVGVGAVVGMALAGAVTWMVSGFLYGISATDLATFVVIPLLLTGVALVAALVPARRAARVDPVRALRSE